MPRGSRPGERRGGRSKGTPNRATVERAAIAARIADEVKMRGQKLGKELLAKYAQVFDEMADERRQAGDVPGFERWARLACATAKDLAPYQSPTYRAVVIAPPHDKPGDDVRVINLKIFEDTGTALGMAARSAQEHPLDEKDVIDSAGLYRRVVCGEK
jgi:hypothetical protein